MYNLNILDYIQDFVPYLYNKLYEFLENYYISFF